MIHSLSHTMICESTYLYQLSFFVFVYFFYSQPGNSQDFQDFHSMNDSVWFFRMNAVRYELWVKIVLKGFNCVKPVSVISFPPPFLTPVHWGRIECSNGAYVSQVSLRLRFGDLHTECLLWKYWNRIGFYCFTKAQASNLCRTSRCGWQHGYRSISVLSEFEYELWTLHVFSVKIWLFKKLI